MHRTRTPQRTRIGVAAAVITAAALVAAGCGGNAESAAPTTTEDKPSPVDEYLATTTTAKPTTTTSTTTTTTPPGAELTVDSSAGWRWRIEIRWDGTSPSAGPRGCVPVAAPGQTNARYTIEVTNLIQDRPSPLPNVSLDTNLDENGAPVLGAPGSSSDPDAAMARIEASMIGELDTYERGEVYIGGTGQLDCVLGFGLEPASAQIPAGGTLTYSGAVGPVPDPPPAELTLFATTWGDTVALPWGGQ